MTNKERIEHALKFYCKYHKCDECILNDEDSLCLKYTFEEVLNEQI